MQDLLLKEIYLASPVLIISVLSVVIIVIDALTGKNRTVVYYLSLIGLLITAIFAGITMNCPLASEITEYRNQLLSSGMLRFGGYSSFFDMVFCLAAILTIIAGRPFIKREYGEYKEFYSLTIFATTGMIIISHAANLLTIFIGIEIMSVTFYVMAGYFRTDIRSVEAALKYFLLGAFATGFLLYGMAMIYGSTGSIDLLVIKELVMTGQIEEIYMLIGIGLIIVGLSFKAAAFPFHQWAPDVYTGSPTIVTGFMSTAGKAAALVAFIVIAIALLPDSSAMESMSDYTPKVQMIIAVISAVTMLLGNITALVQRNVKRMLAFSSVAHAGYLLMGIVANTPRGWTGILFYSMAYLFMQIGAFIIVSVLERKDDRSLMIDNYNGLSRRYPVLAALMAVFMFSLAGIPPFAGFFGKYYLFTAAIASGFTWLTIVAVISSIISVYFYIGLVMAMYFKEPGEESTQAVVGAAGISLAVATAGLIIFGIFPFLITDIAANFF
ncbi:MAG: NADH-quinone oxidoreductase subunit N [Candidatus Kapaibacterium sp.]